MSAMWSSCQVRNIPFEEQKNSFFLSLGQGVYVFEERPKSVQDVIGDVYCPGEFCPNREKCESIGGYVTTPRSIYGCGKCGARLFVHKVPFTLQEHVRRQKQTKHALFCEKRCYPTNNCSLMSHFNQPNIEKKELSVDDKVRETIGDVYCPTCRNEKCVYISTSQTTIFYDCKKCKACCNVLNIPFKAQKPTIMLFGGDGTHCFHESRLQRTISIFEKIPPPITIKHIRT